MHTSSEAIAALMYLVVCSIAALSFRMLMARCKEWESKKAWKVVGKYIV